MAALDAVASVPPGFVLKELTAFASKDRILVKEKISKIERKVFPSNEGFDYEVELKKKNIGLLVVFKEGTLDAVAYLVYQRMKRLVWLHKLCVIESAREKGLGKFLVHSLCHRMEKGGCQSIQLWVDEHRKPARALYASCGFQQIEHRPDYYAPGRAGLRLELAVGE